MATSAAASVAAFTAALKKIGGTGEQRMEALRVLQKLAQNAALKNDSTDPNDDK